MILMLAPSANMTFASLPSGSTYVSDANGLIYITNNSVADALALAAAGCQTLTPIPGGAVSTQTGTAYTVQNSDQGDTILFTDASAVTVTLPNAVPVGFVVELLQAGMGQVSAVAAGGAGVVTPNLASTPGQYASLVCIVIANASGTNAEWDVIASGFSGAAGLIGATTLAGLYSQDSSSHYAQYTIAQVFADGTSANDGVWLKTGSGNGSGNWTQQASVTLAGLASQVTANTANIATNTANIAANTNMLALLQYTLAPAATASLPAIDAGGGLYWAALVLDAGRKILWGRKSDGSEWTANGTATLIQVVASALALNGPTLENTANASLPLMDAGGGLYWLTLLLDANRKIVWGQKSDGSVWEAGGGSALAQTSGSGPVPSYATDTNWVGPANPHTSGVYGTLTVVPNASGFLDLHIGMGQSLDLGTNLAAFDATFTTSALDGTSCLMPAQGTVPAAWNASSEITSLAACYETGTPNSPQTYETWCSRAGHAIQNGFSAAGLTGPKQAFVIAARSGTPYVGVKRGTPIYAQMMNYIAQIKQCAAAQGLTLRVRSFVTMEGGNNAPTSRDEFANDMLMWRRDLEADARAITGQTEPVVMFLSQCGVGGGTAGNPNLDPMTELANVDVMDIDPAHCVVSHPSYAIGPQDNAGGANAGMHWLAMGYAQHGEQFGHAILRHVYGASHKPVRLLRGVPGAYWSGKYQITLSYNRPIAIDTSNAIVDDSQLANHGFTLADQSGSPPTITGVSLKAATATFSVSGSQVTFTGLPTQGSIEAVVIVYNGVSYGMDLDENFTTTMAAAGFAAAIPGASSSTNVLTLMGAPTSVTAYANALTITLSGEPLAASVLRYATLATGAGGVGNQTGGRGTVRAPFAFANSAVARGLFSLSANPAANDTVTVNGVVITFVASGATGNQVNIGANAAATVLALYTFLSGSSNTSLRACRYTINGPGTGLIVYGAAGGPAISASSSAITTTAMAAIPQYDWALAQRVDLPPI